MVLTQFLPMDSYYHGILAATELSTPEIDKPCEKRESCLRGPKMAGDCLQINPCQDNIVQL